MKNKLFLGFLLILSLSTLVLAQEPNQVALVVVLEDGLAITQCVEFAEEQISGFEVLARSGLAVESSQEGMGTAVCRIEGTGCSGNDCFCQCKGGECRYWSYWHLKEGEWEYSQAGAGNYLVDQGDVEGWTWGLGTVSGAVEPPPVSFEEVCAVDAEVLSTQYPVSSEQLTVNSTPTSIANLQSPETAVPNTSTPQNDVSWMGYVVFGVIMVVLGAGFVWRRKTTQR